MGWNDHLDDYDDLGDLPIKAFGQNLKTFDPDDDWLRTARRKDKVRAMRAWFKARYCDPAEETPYNGREGGYIFVHGGPYDPADVLGDRFSGVVKDEIIQEVVDEMHHEVGDEWAPLDIEPPDDYEFDDRFDLSLKSKNDPLRKLMERIQQAQSVTELRGDAATIELVQTLAFGAAIAALEAFLWETVDFWVEHDNAALRSVVTNIPALRDKPLTLGQIFDQHSNLKDQVKGYLQNIVWHRWDKVAPLLRDGLGIQPPSFKAFEVALIKRHDIVHRSGHDKLGNSITVTRGEMSELCKEIEKFAKDVQSQLDRPTEF